MLASRSHDNNLLRGGVDRLLCRGVCCPFMMYCGTVSDNVSLVMCCCDWLAAVTTQTGSHSTRPHDNSEEIIMHDVQWN